MNNLKEQAVPPHRSKYNSVNPPILIGPLSSTHLPLLNHGPERLVRRFLSFIEVNENGCWMWTGRTDGRTRPPGAYARFCYAGCQKSMRAHRLSYQWMHGESPALLDHFVCDTPLCVNPSHVRPETPWGNSIRGNNWAAVHARKTHCPQGHEYTPENTVMVGKNKTGRRCRTCARAYSKAREEDITISAFFSNL